MENKHLTRRAYANFPLRKQGDDYQIKDEFWLDKNNTERTSSTTSGMAEVSHDVLKYTREQ